MRINLRSALWLAGLSLAFLGTIYAFQKPFRQYHGVEYYSFETPPDADEKAEFAFARLMFPGGWNDGYRGRFDGDWRLGMTLWTQDYPRADRHFSEAVRRLTRVNTRAAEQPINLDEEEEFDWPWLYAVQVGEWGLTPKQGKELREYLLRGGFFAADDFHGVVERQVFEDSMKPSWTFPTTTRYSTPSTTLTIAFRSPDTITYDKDVRTARTAVVARTGAASTTTKAGS